MEHRMFVLRPKMPLKQSKSVYFFIFIFKGVTGSPSSNLINHNLSVIIHTGTVGGVNGGDGESIRGGTGL